jgi:uncharacterized protein (DUF924 family)
MANPPSTASIEQNNSVQAILTFWFGNPEDPEYGQYRKVWFVKDADFDAEIRQRFSSDIQKAAAGDYAHWTAVPISAVALILLLDQFPRNLYRGSAQSFATDAQALQVAQQLVTTGAHKTLLPAYRFFAYLPFEHSEAIAHQHRCVELMAALIADIPDLDPGLKGGLEYAIRHRDVIERFGRFPHRNEILNRQSTPAEIAFLQQPGSRF